MLKHTRNWSFEVAEREVRANVVCRQFTGIGAEKLTDAKTIARLVQALGPEVIKQIHQRLVELAQEKKAVRGRKLRVDTTVVETNVHYPTDSSLLRDGARVLGRDAHVPGKLVSVFDPSTEVIRREKASEPNELGKIVKILETENRIVNDYEMFAKRPSDSGLLVPAVEKHQDQFGQVPGFVAGDAAFYCGGAREDTHTVLWKGSLDGLHCQNPSPAPPFSSRMRERGC